MYTILWDQYLPLVVVYGTCKQCKVARLPGGLFSTVYTLPILLYQVILTEHYAICRTMYITCDHAVYKIIGNMIWHMFSDGFVAKTLEKVVL